MRRIKQLDFPVKLDLGCGNTEATKKGWVGIDMEDFGQDIVWNIADGIPLPDDSVEELYSSHFVEHLRENEIEKVMKEIVRICKHDAVVTIHCPHSNCSEAYFLAHYSLWNEHRIKGICMGQRYNWPGHFEIEYVKIDGIELRTKLIVKKDNIRNK